MELPHKLFSRFALIITGVSLASGLLAQSDRGSISGSVADPTGAIIPGATVIAIQPATNQTREAVSTDTGNYTISELPAGIYNLKVTKGGFKTYEQDGITVKVGVIATVDITLQLGSIAQTVEVTADATLLKVEDAELATSITNEKLDRLPLDFSNNIRNPMSFLKLVPGADINTDKANSGWPITSQNGLQSFTEEIRIDGAPSTNPTPGVFNEAQPSVDAIQEYNVQTSNFNPEYGQAGGAILNYSLKSGTNQFHGTVYEMLRNEVFNAKDKDLAPADPKGRQRRHDFGGTAGGPFVIPHLYNGRNRTFWFSAYEQFYTRDHQTTFWSVPRAEWRQGDLSSLLQPTILGTDVLGRPIQQGQIYDPATTRTEVVGGQSYVVRDPFLNNQIPLRSEVAKKILSFIPQATTAGLDADNLLGITGEPQRDHKIWSLKVDHNFSSASHLSSSFNYMFSHKINGADPFGVASAARDQTITSKVFRVNHDYTIGTSMINHFTVGLLRYQNPDGVPDKGFDPAKELGLKGPLITGWFPYVDYGQNTLGLSPIGTNQLKHLYHTVPTFTDSFSMVRGAHTLKFGAEYRRSLANFFGANTAYGSLTFNAAQTGLPYMTTNSAIYSKTGAAFASFLLGDVGSAGLNSPVNMAYRYSDYAFYAQDTYKISPKFTLTYGLRYDLHRPLTEKYFRISSFVPDLPNPGAGNLPGALGFLGYGTGRVGRSSWLDTDFHDFGPRIGGAYRLTNKTVLRGGFGLVYGRVEVNTFDPIQSTGSGSVTTAYPNINQATQYLFSLDSGFPAVNTVPPDLDPTLLNNQTINAFTPQSGKMPRIYNWNFTVQHELTNNLTVETAYVGNKGTRLLAGFLKDLNQNDYRVLALGDTLLNPISSAADAAALGVKYPYPGFSGTVAQALRPYPQYLSIFDPQATVGESNYNALQIKVQQRTSHGLDFLVAYTLAKNITNVDDAFGWGGYGVLGTVNAKNLKLERGLAVDTTFSGSRGDRTHNLVPAFGYDLPFAKDSQSRVVRQLAGGWRVSGILQYASGGALPVSPYYPNNLANVIFNNEGRYDRVSGMAIRNNVSNPWPGVSYMFNPAAFADPKPYTLGNAARTYGQMRGFPILNEDLSITKQVVFRESKRIELRVDMFNLFNRSIFNDPSTAVYDTPRIQSGRAIGYGTFWGRKNFERQMQLSAKIVF